ncbi:hypothetical protein KY325_05140 [Candidatus Woesearchaeota archaeon]|nr:hypothetical protein [Candidatus Woesearchaeota archaeon]MBW3018519.1 hypothetical protein [Candidatus Woesearchaeota archaeon]
MADPKVIKEKPVSMAELKAELARIKKRDGDAGFRAEKTEEYLNVFVKISHTKAKELHDELEKLQIPRLAEDHIIKIIDIMPANVEELKVVLQGYALTVSKENMKKICDAVAKYL